MKKDFLKKLALVMALTLTVTSVPATSASAATAPGFKSKAVKLNVGQTKKYSTANSAKYSVKFKIGNKSVATIKSSKGSKSVKVTGVAAGKTTLRADFKSYKTKKVTTARVSVTVAEEATALKTVEAKGVKTLVVTFNKAVDDTKAVLAVTKGSAKPSVASTKWADDKKSVTITTGSKLTEGTYTVTVTGLTEAALAGSVTVQDETLTSVEIVGTNLVADATTASMATIGFKTLNQYGERMTITNPSVSSSFGKASVTKSCTTTATGVIEVKEIPTTLQIIGTSGSITVVDTTKGINATATVTYSAAATAKTMTIAGLYNVTDAKFKDMTKGDKVTDYVVLASVQDQYGNDLNKDKLGKVTANLVQGGGVTGVGAWQDKTVDGKDYVALPLTGSTADTGVFYFTFVNPTLGLLANTSFTVGAGTVLKTFNISANDSVYEDQDNELNFEAIDANGAAVTKYDDLYKNVKFSVNDGDTVEFVKKADGTAKLVFKPYAKLAKDGSVKTSTIHAFTTSVNDSKTTNFFVKSLTFTTYAKRVAKAVTGLKTGTATAVASGQTLKLNATDLVVEDQYSNVMSDSDVKALTNINIAVEGTTITVDNTTMPTAHFVTLTASADTSKTTDIKFGIGIKDNKPNTTDYTAVYTVVDPKTASNLTIKKVNSDHVVKANGVKPTLATTDIEVTGVVAGKTVVIPSTQYVVSGNTGYDLGNTSTPGVTAQTLTGTVEVTVDTKDGAIVLTKDFTFSNAASTITTIEAKEDGKLTAGTLTNAQFAALFTIKDQYGVELTNPTAVKYDVVEMSSNSRVISHNKTNAASVVASKDDKFAVTASYGTITASAEKTVE